MKKVEQKTINGIGDSCNWCACGAHNHDGCHHVDCPIGKQERFIHELSQAIKSGDFAKDWENSKL